MKPRILISACALGDKVRYNAEAKEDKFSNRTLRDFVDFHKVCPEMSMGLGAPRETLRLVRDKDTKKALLKTTKTEKDYTELAETTSKTLLDEITEPIDGMILMARSPSCGPSGIKVFEPNGIPSHEGVGIFGGIAQKTHPLVATIDVGRLNDRALRYKFLTHVFVLARLREVEPKVSALQEFHKSNKYLYMAYRPDLVYELGKLCSEIKDSFEKTVTEYKEILKEVFKAPLEEGKFRNAVSHVYGHLKNDMPEAQKKSFLKITEDQNYNFFEKSFIALEILQYENLRQQNDYVAIQTLFCPFPKELM